VLELLLPQIGEEEDRRWTGEASHPAGFKEACRVVGVTKAEHVSELEILLGEVT
jgi:hypothetical protein